MISFQRGWERGDWVHIGNSLEKVITIVDGDKEFARVTGSIVANPALKERYFSNFIMSKIIQIFQILILFKYGLL